MNPNLLVVFNIGDEDPICELFLPYWRRSGSDLLFSSPLDCPSQIPGVNHVQFGRKLTGKREDYWFYQSRVLDTFKYCLSLPYDGFIFTQYDSVCFGKLPFIHPSDSIHAKVCGPKAPYESKVCLHPPWCFGKERLEEFTKYASQEPIELEYGVMDRWLPCIMQRHGLPWQHCQWAWSQNAIDTPEFIEMARSAIAAGCLFIHGVKNKKQLHAIIDSAPVLMTN
jgi:hypothetical protein